MHWSCHHAGRHVARPEGRHPPVVLLVQGGVPVVGWTWAMRDSANRTLQWGCGGSLAHVKTRAESAYARWVADYYGRGAIIPGIGWRARPAPR